MLSAVPAVREARRASAAVSGDDEAVEADDPCGDDRAFVLPAFPSGLDALSWDGPGGKECDWTLVLVVPAPPSGVELRLDDGDGNLPTLLSLAPTPLSLLMSWPPLAA